MSTFNTYLVEIDDDPAGILIRGTSGSFAFHAVDASFSALEGESFPDALAAERAVRRLRRARPVSSLRAAA